MSLNIYSTKPGYQNSGLFTNPVSFNRTTTNGYWKTNLWNNCVFCTPLFEGSGQTITDIITGNTATANTGGVSNPNGTPAQWQQDVYGVGLRTFGTYDAIPPSTLFEFQNDAGLLNTNLTVVYYGRFYMPPASQQPFLGYYVLASNIYNSNGTESAGIYMGTTTYPGSVVVGGGCVGVSLDNGSIETTSYVGDGALVLIGCEYNLNSNIATVYVNGAAVATAAYTPPVSSDHPVIDVFCGNMLSAYQFILNSCPGPAFHAALATDPFAPFITQEPASLGEPINYGSSMRS